MTTDVKQPDSEAKVWGLISYFWVLSLVALASRKKDDFVKFHASQGALMFVISLPCIFIPMVGWLINLLLGILAIVGMVKSLQGEKWELPLIGSFAPAFGDWLIKTFKL
ncbi:MAG: hypothetical protein RB292_03635 [Patescibacteria group bacterium]|jgi:uncharacterized membrane protein|nr:hypothetical protein [Patescibacteria group bacterium]